MQVRELRHEALTPLHGLLLACLLVARIVVVKISLKSLRRDGKKSVDGIGFDQTFRLLFDRAVEELIAVYQGVVFRWIQRQPGLPRLLRHRQRLLRVIHQAVPASVGSGLFILHKPHPGAVKEIACRQQRDAGQIQLALLLPRQQVLLLVALGFVQGGVKQE